MASFYLTIDDGPSKDMPEKLRFLRNHDIPAIWFCLGMNIEKYPQVVIQAIQQGHIIGNHSYSHPFFSKSTLEQCVGEVVTTEKIIEAIYQNAGISRPIKLFRFPYGEQGHFEDGNPSQKTEKLAHKKNLQQLLSETGFQSPKFSSIEYHGIYSNQPEDKDWLWSYDIQDWAIDNEGGYTLSFEQAKENLRTYLKSYDRAKNQIILTHDHERTAQYFSQLMDLFLTQNSKFSLPNFE